MTCFDSFSPKDLALPAPRLLIPLLRPNPRVVPSRTIRRKRMRADLSRDVSFVTALLLFGWHLTQTYAYRDEARAQVDDAWERPLIARAGGAPLWDRDEHWLAELRRVQVPWATEVLALPYLYLSTVRS